MLCSAPECSKTNIFARGLCQSCYYRLRRNGTVQRKNVQNIGPCSMVDCGKPSFAKGMCAHHYRKAQHPLDHLWRILRSRNPGQYPPEWDHFDRFLEAVGERPGPKHQFRRVRTDLPFSPDNFQWLAPLRPEQDDMTPEERSTYGREWHLQRKFNITGEEFARMLVAQGGVCATCKQPETHRYKSGKLKELAVDHDHQSLTVRGLLCFNCNQGIGRFKDDPDLLEAAAAYLRHHKSPRLVCTGEAA